MIFLVEKDPEGGFNARALGESIYTEADTLEELKKQVRNALECHFDDQSKMPSIIRLHIVRDEVYAYA